MVSQIESGRLTPSLHTLGKIAAALGVPIAALFDGQPAGRIQVTRSKDYPVVSFDGSSEQLDGARRRALRGQDPRGGLHAGRRAAGVTTDKVVIKPGQMKLFYVLDGTVGAALQRRAPPARGRATAPCSTAACRTAGRTSAPARPASSGSSSARLERDGDERHGRRRRRGQVDFRTEPVALPALEAAPSTAAWPRWPWTCRRTAGSRPGLRAEAQLLRPRRGHRALRRGPAAALRASRGRRRRPHLGQGARLLRGRQHPHAGPVARTAGR